MGRLERNVQGPSSSTPEKHANTATSLSQGSGSSLRVADEDRIPKIHSKTFLAIFAVSTMYFAQVYCLVGAGAVSADLLTHLDNPNTIPPGYRDLTFSQQGSSISAQFGAAAQSSWLSGAMAIFTVVLGPIVAQAADYWGRKWFLVGLSFSGALGSLVVALATSMSMVVAGCCLVGTVFGVQPLLQWVLPLLSVSVAGCLLL